MAFSEEHDGVCVVFSLDDAADAADVARLSGRVARVLDDGVRGLVWDLEGVQLLSSTFVGLLLHARRKLHAAGGHMALAHVGRRARATLRTFGVEDVLTVLPTRAEALRRARGEGVSGPGE